MGGRVVNVADFYHKFKNHSVTSLATRYTTSSVKWGYGV